MPINLDNTTLVKTRVTPFSREPLLGLLTLETDQGRKRIKIDEESANDLLEEILAFFGVPRSPPPSP